MKYSANIEDLSSDDMELIAWNAIEPLWDDVTYSTPQKLSVFMSELSEGQAALLALDWCQKEIRNGGIEQLLKNSTGNFIPYIDNALKLIGASDYIKIFSTITNTLGEPFPNSASARKKALKNLSAKDIAQLNAAEDEFFELLDKNPVTITMGFYVKENLNQFTSI